MKKNFHINLLLFQIPSLSCGFIFVAESEMFKSSRLLSANTRRENSLRDERRFREEKKVMNEIQKKKEMFQLLLLLARLTTDRGGKKSAVNYITVCT